MAEEKLLLKTAVIEENRENGRETAAAFTWPVENRNGFVFGVLEAKSRSAFAQTVAEIVRDRFGHLATTLQESTSISRCFEQTLEVINEEIANRSNEMEAFPVEHLNAVVGLAVDNTMYISGTGELVAIFLHKLPEGRYQVFNLARSIQNEQAGANWQKLFVVVLDGTLNPGDIFCICNHDLQQEMPPEELHSLLATLPPQSAAVKLRQYFPLETDLSLSILKVGSSDEERSQVSAPASIKQLQASREQTKRVLSDQKPTFFKTFFFWLFTFFKDQRIVWRLARNLTRLIISSVVVVFFMLRDLVLWILNLGRRLISSDRKEIFTSATSRLSNSTFLVRQKLGRLPKTSKYLLLAAVAVIIVIIFSVLLISRGHQASEERAAFESAITKVESLHDAAESALIYKDETKAKNILNQAKTALEAIVTDNEENQSRIDKVRSELETTANGLRKITEIENPEVLASKTAEQPNLRTLTLVDGEIYAGSDSNNLFQLNKSNKSFDQIASGDFGRATKFTFDGGIIAFLDNQTNPTVNLFDVANKTIKAAASAPTGEKWVDLYAYADRLYVLSPGTGLTSQIYKFTRTGLELGSQTSWIKSPINELVDAVSLAVDGTVFVLRSNGKILRFVGGRDVAWSQGSVEPELTSATKIWASVDSSYLYVLDQAGQRVVVYEKESGLLKAQYHSSSFNNLEDFVVDEAGKVIYLLGNGNVYKVELEFLK
ncbi:MAG: hypothetical protein V1716_02590 [Candidatus Uhrbacteria bacterium]